MNAEEFYVKWIKGVTEKHTKREVVMLQMRDDFHLIFAQAYHKAEVENKISKLTNKHYNRLRNSQGDAECRRLLKEQLLKQ